MLKIKRYFSALCLILTLLATFSCVDDGVTPFPSEDPVNPNLPKEFQENYSISFNITLDALGDESTLLSDVITGNTYLREIENFVDLEKLRILFFTCTNPSDDSGKTDYFLFESRSRWVSKLTDAETTQANWQVTAPVFTYGNNEIYDWEAIRYALTHNPFKIAILVNRPDYVNFGNFDTKFSKDVVFDTDRGPNWGSAQTYIDPDFVDSHSDRSVNTNTRTINDLHHCQWDPIYSSKNNKMHVYDFIMKKPNGDEDVPLTIPADVEAYNLMGALSYWTEKKQATDDKGNLLWEDPAKTKPKYVEDPKKAGSNANFYFHPSPIQGIPMYGVQEFNALTDWKEGSPYNVSLQLSGTSGAYERKNIHLLRSLVKLELKIPRTMTDENGNTINLEIDEPCLHYSNVMARCEPLDVATPTEKIWKSEKECEWEDIFQYGPIITQDINGGKAYTTTQEWVNFFHSREAWFYGAWKDWWHFNYGNIPAEDQYGGSAVYGLNKDTYYRNDGTKYPHIFNPVMQRNGNAYLDDCKIDTDPDFHYYVVYTGEKNINDPSTLNIFSLSTAELVYFSFKVNKVQYYLAITDYSTNSLISQYAQNGNMTTYKTNMPSDRNNWSWPLLRNHVYTFTVTKFGDFLDLGGINSSIVSTEIRTAPDIIYD